MYKIWKNKLKNHFKIQKQILNSLISKNKKIRIQIKRNNFMEVG